MNDCCQVGENLAAAEQLSQDLAVRICAVCGAKHYELTVDFADMVSEGVEA